jgi:hypothetical protein
VRPLTITVTIDGRLVSDFELKSVYLARARKTLSDMIELGAAAGLNGMAVGQSDVEALDLEQVKTVLRESKERLGRSGLLSLYREQLLKSDQMWREIAAASPPDRDFQASTAEIRANGVSIGQFMTLFYKMTRASDLTIFHDIHPEHFVTETPKFTRSTVMEVLGMHGEPMYMYMDIKRRGKGILPISIDHDTDAAMIAYGRLMSDGTPIHLIAVHQFKNTDTGMLMKAGIFFPAAAPKEMVDGHKMHLAVEMANTMRIAHGIKRSVMPVAINTALRYTKF